jgi:hypothetical protein
MVAMNLIGAQPHLRREMCVGIPQMFYLALHGTPWFYGAVLGRVGLRGCRSGAGVLVLHACQAG